MAIGLDVLGELLAGECTTKAGPKGKLPPVELRRYRLDLDGGAVRSEPLADGSLELPRIDAGATLQSVGGSSSADR